MSLKYMTSKNIEDDCGQIYQKSEIVAKTRMPDVFVILWVLLMYVNHSYFDRY